MLLDNTFAERREQLDKFTDYFNDKYNYLNITGLYIEGIFMYCYLALDDSFHFEIAVDLTKVNNFEEMENKMIDKIGALVQLYATSHK